MLDLTTAFKRKQLADRVRELRSLRGQRVAATSTLLRKPGTALAELVRDLCGNDYAVADDGRVVPSVGAEPAAQAPVLPGADSAADNYAGDTAAVPAPEPPAPDARTEAPAAEPTLRPAPLPSQADAAAAAAPEPAAAGKPDVAEAEEDADEAETPGRAPTIPADGIIIVLRAENPKRPGSASHARYALLRSGMTVAEYIAAAGPRGRRTLRKGLRQGHVRVDVAGVGKG